VVGLDIYLVDLVVLQEVEILLLLVLLKELLVEVEHKAEEVEQVLQAQHLVLQLEDLVEMEDLHLFLDHQ
jgi:hypothetical protein